MCVKEGSYRMGQLHVCVTIFKPQKPVPSSLCVQRRTVLLWQAWGADAGTVPVVVGVPGQDLG